MSCPQHHAKLFWNGVVAFSAVTKFKLNWTDNSGEIHFFKGQFSFETKNIVRVSGAYNIYDKISWEEQYICQKNRDKLLLRMTHLIKIIENMVMRYPEDRRILQIVEELKISRDCVSRTITRYYGNSRSKESQSSSHLFSWTLSGWPGSNFLSNSN